jgi:hypothetical protein
VAVIWTEAQLNQNEANEVPGKVLGYRRDSSTHTPNIDCLQCDAIVAMHRLDRAELLNLTAVSGDLDDIKRMLILSTSCSF